MENIIIGTRCYTMHDTNMAHKKINYLETHIPGSRTAEVGIIGRQA